MISDQWATIVYFFRGVVDVVESEFCCRPRFSELLPAHTMVEEVP